MWWHLHALLHQLYVLVDTHHRAVVLHVDMLLADRLDETDLARSACRCGRNEGAVQVCRCSARPADLAEALAQTVHQRERDGSLAHMLPYRRHEERPRHCSSRGALKRSLASIGCCPIGWFSGVAQTPRSMHPGGNSGLLVSLPTLARRCTCTRRAMVASRKAACSGQGDKQSKVVEQFAKGFVPSSAATESEKQAQRTWDRSSLLQVDDNDSQVGIFNAYAQKANTDAEGKSTKRGLGAASAPASGRRGGMGMMFVSAGGALSSTLQAASWRCRGLPRRTPGRPGAHGFGSRLHALRTSAAAT